MARPRRNEMWMAKRGDSYYAFWYDAAKRSTCRRSLRTFDPGFAAQRFEEFKLSGVAEGYPGAQYQDPRWQPFVKKMRKRAIENARTKNRYCDITVDEIFEILGRQGYVCAVSNLPFDLTPRRRNPFAPSLDQVDPGTGYTAWNIRVVSVIVNTAMNEWGEAPLLRLIHAARNTTRAISRQSCEIDSPPDTRQTDEKLTRSSA